MLNSITLIWIALSVLTPLNSNENNNSAYPVRVATDYDARQAEFVFKTPPGITADSIETASLSINNPDGTTTIVKNRSISAESTNEFSITADLPVFLPWHPDTPNLYTAQITLNLADGIQVDLPDVRFGVRKLETKNAHFYVNDKPFYVRACGHEIDSITQNLDRTGCLKRLRQMRAYGFNTVRHHSHIPSKVYRDAADEVGVFIQMELKGKIGTSEESARFKETRQNWIDMICEGRNHPSTFIYSLGNEIYSNAPGLIRCQNHLYDLAKKLDPTTLVLNRSGSNPLNDDHGKYDLIERPIGEYEHVSELVRDALELYLRGDRKGRSDKFPIIAHEYPLVANYPNPELIAKYEEEPFWFKFTNENAVRHGLDHLLPIFTENAQRIQTICRKEMLEEARKYPELDGYSMLRFADCVERVSGVVDDFSDPKDISAEVFKRTNGETVLLCTWNRRSFAYGETLQAEIMVSHHGGQVHETPECKWWLMNGPKVLAKGTLPANSVNPVDVTQLGKIQVEIPRLCRPAKLTLRATLPGTSPFINNDWSFWAFPQERLSAESQKGMTIWDLQKRFDCYAKNYPAARYNTDENFQPSGSDELIVTDSWSESFYDYLENGGNIWVIADKCWPWPEEVGIFGLHITRSTPTSKSPVVFPELDEACNKWMTICSNAKSRHGNSGTVIYPHPALANLPNEGFCDLNFWPLLYRAKTLHLDRFPGNPDPVIRAIDSFYRGESKGYMLELTIGKGCLFISTMNFTQVYERDIVARYLFDQLLRYLTGENRVPAATILVAQLRKTIKSFEKEYADREPLTRDEMPARYTTRWQWLLSPYELITIPIYDAHGVTKDKLDVHWEYAQTQWFYNAGPGDELTFEFSNRNGSEFICKLYLAGPLEQQVIVTVDGENEQPIEFKNAEGWNRFVETTFVTEHLNEGRHKLTIRIPDDAQTRDQKAIQIRDVQLQSVDKR